MRFQLAIDGVADRAQDAEPVAARLATLTGQDAAAARRLLASGRRVVKRDMDLASARRLAAAVNDTGASCSVELMLDADLLRRVTAPAGAAGLTRAGPRWTLNVGKLKPWVLGLSRRVPVKAANGHTLFAVRSRRLVLGKLFRLFLVIEVTLQAQGAVINAAIATLGSGLLTSALGIVFFFGLLYALAVAARVPRRMEITGAGGQPSLQLVQHELPWTGVSGYRLLDGDGAILAIIRRDAFRKITKVHDADGELDGILEPAADADDQGEGAATDLAEEFLDAGPYGYLRDFAGWLMGGERERWALRSADGRVMATGEIGSQLTLRLHGRYEEPRRLLAVALVAAGV